MADLALLAASCLGTAIWEEALFRGLLPRAVAKGLGARCSTTLGVCAVCSAFFAIAHLDVTAGAAVALARLAQTFSFGMVMACLCLTRRGLALAVALHAGYDLICLGAAYACPGIYQAGAAALGPAALLGYVTTVPAILASLAILAPLALLASVRLHNAEADQEAKAQACS